MILHALIIDDQQEILDGMIPDLIDRLQAKLGSSTEFRKANEAAGFPLPRDEKVCIRVSTHGYASERVPKVYPSRKAVHVRLHLCKETDGFFGKATKLIQEHFVAVVLSDLKLPPAAGDQAGRHFLAFLHERCPEIYGILYSSSPSEIAEFPADRFIRKAQDQPGNEKLCDKMVEGFTAYLNQKRIKQFALALKKHDPDSAPLLYRSDEFGKVLYKLYDIAHTTFAVAADASRYQPLPTLLLNGETGNGKSQLARLLHRVCARAEQPFCAADSADFKEKQFLFAKLFGHEAGVFTDAKKSRLGLVTKAESGILLLDDLHMIDKEASQTLHTFLDTGYYTPMGGDRLRSNAGIVCTVESTRWNEIKAEKLLPDSFIDRVRKDEVIISSLCEPDRRDDLVCLVDHYCAEHERERNHPIKLTDDAVEWLIDFKPVVKGVRTLKQFLDKSLSKNRMLWKLDAAELEACARENGWLPKPSAIALRAVQQPGSLPPLEPLWADVPSLAAKFLKTRLKLDQAQAEQLIEQLFAQDFPDIWQRFRDWKAANDAFDLQLFEKLLRFYAVLAEGNVVKAAKQLGTTREAVRLHIDAARKLQ